MSGSVLTTLNHSFIHSVSQSVTQSPPTSIRYTNEVPNPNRLVSLLSEPVVDAVECQRLLLLPMYGGVETVVVAAAGRFVAMLWLLLLLLLLLLWLKTLLLLLFWAL